jgi:hypothetical protein
MLPYGIAEELVRLRQQDLLAEAAAERRLVASPAGGVRRALATTLAALARRIDPAVWEGQIGKLQLPTGDAG